MNKILVTGGCGYIGSHTLVDLIQNGYEVISADNNIRSLPVVLEGVKEITGRNVKNYKIDLCNYDDTYAIFEENQDIRGIIHFAAFKAVGESVERPLMYYENNLTSLLNLLSCVQEFQIPYFIFSSSCSVYGQPDQAPVTEETPLKPAESPYAATKQMGERILQDFLKTSNTQGIILRYFNPAGAHPSGKIGELPVDPPQNLIPVITRTASGRQKKMYVHGADYPTRDGSCIRDFIHVCDIASAHTLALGYVEQKKNTHQCEIFNLGSGHGTSVLETIQAFEEMTGIKINYEIGPRRPGDVISVFANHDKAKKQLGWTQHFDLKDILLTAWKWEQRICEDETLFQNNKTDLN
ncbi:MAG: UDP-glucose 4-epimerase GalE [Chitinophagaceae bacterium]|nr:UDP-glucose 4-epimerase GalE [Chitinophagaceae bacterium]